MDSNVASFVRGQPDFTSGIANNPTVASGLSGVASAFYTGSTFFIVDTTNNRVQLLLSPTAPTALLTFGGGATTPVSATSLNQPWSLADDGVSQYVADTYAHTDGGGEHAFDDVSPSANNRILRYSSSITADAVFGQAINDFSGSTAGVASNRLNQPRGLVVTVSPLRMFVADSGYP